MRPPNRFARSQRMTVINGVLALAVILVVLQIWLLTATMEAYLGGDLVVPGPAALASIVCLGLNLLLLRSLYRLES